MAAGRWFRRVILRKPVEAEEAGVLIPAVFSFGKRRLGADWSPRKRWVILGGMFAAQIGVVVAFFALDGIHHVQMILNSLR